MTVDHKSEIVLEEALVTRYYLNVLPNHIPAKTEKNLKTLSYGNRTRDRDSKPAPAEYEAECQQFSLEFQFYRLKPT